jgi:hypothetical protein
MTEMNKPGRAAGRAMSYVVGIVGSLLIVAALVQLMKQYTRPEPLGQDRTAERYKNLTQQRETDSVQLNQYGWEDAGKGIVRLPIQRAIEIAVQEWKNPAAARSNLILQAEKKTALPPAEPAKPTGFE